METALKNQLEKTWNLTGLEEKEEYILTKDEEEKAVQAAIDQHKNYLVWKMKGLGYTEIQIGQRIKEGDWAAMIDRESVLSVANGNKHQDIWHQNQRLEEAKRQKEQYETLKQKWTAKNMLQLMKWTSKNILGRQFIINPDNTLLIKTLCFFLSNDERFEKELGYSFQKGLLIRGISGIGKTHLVQCVSGNELNPVLILSMLEICEQVKAEGEFIIELKDKKIIYVDDVGTEEHIVNHYGTKINWFKNFIEMYYLRNRIYNKLIISTNNSFSELEEKYGFRVRSRIKDMFNIIDVKGIDMRGGDSSIKKEAS
jgi:DNA replication protein DnaC